MVAVAEVISTIGASIGLVKELNKVDQSLDVATYKLTIAELTTRLADAQIGLIEIRGELNSKDDEIQRLKEFKRKDIELLELEGALYKTVDGEPVGNQICPICREKEQILIETRHAAASDVCPNCESVMGRKAEYLYPPHER